MKKKAFITGVTGQDGSYLAELLLKKNYEVHGLVRRSSSINIGRILHIYEHPQTPNKKFFAHYGDVTDAANIMHLIQMIQPDEIYNLAAQSHVRVSFETPEHTANADALGPLRILEAIRILGLTNKAKFFQASTSEMFGKVLETPQCETTSFYPRSPYGVAKLYGHWITINYREAYAMFACCGIFFNHESPRRGETFVSRKIVQAVANIVSGKQNCLYLGNLYAKRDWGYAKEYVEAMWLMLQQPEPQEYVIATGETHSVKKFVEEAFKAAGLPNWQKHVKIDPRFKRPAEVPRLRGKADKARAKLG